ncbi:MAG: dephospho-CoA kinase [Candidatus Dormibacteraceae bacterium]
MKLIGLTGGIGSGKSTVAAMLRDLGATVIDADKAARAVVEPGTPGFDEVVAEFGETYVREGRLDRAGLAELVFSDEEARRRLDAIVHPRVRDWMAARQAAASERGDPTVVLEIPLLYENGLDAGMDAVIVVHISAEMQVGRLVGGAGYTEADARARIAAQLPIAAKVRRATHVIDNSGTREATRGQVDRVWREITRG